MWVNTNRDPTRYQQERLDLKLGNQQSIQQGPVKKEPGKLKNFCVFKLCLRVGRWLLCQVFFRECFNLPSLKLTNRTWRWMVGRLGPFFGRTYLQGRTVSFREGKHFYTQHGLFEDLFSYSTFRVFQQLVRVKVDGARSWTLAEFPQSHWKISRKVLVSKKSVGPKWLEETTIVRW